LVLFFDRVYRGFKNKEKRTVYECLKINKFRKPDAAIYSF
jgi:hypothetical protein